MQRWLIPHFNTWLQHTFYEIVKINSGLGDGGRTRDLTVISRVLCQLSYPEFWWQFTLISDRRSYGVAIWFCLGVPLLQLKSHLLW